mmetsp:Transcript_56114/g.173978  ORF Transcript_56114/g.173978 Transcript_56114/m.173978 type:complete len:219 (-) Transcript_56114:884-1540(-)
MTFMYGRPSGGSRIWNSSLPNSGFLPPPAPLPASFGGLSDTLASTCVSFQSNLMSFGPHFLSEANCFKLTWKSLLKACVLGPSDTSLGTAGGSLSSAGGPAAAEGSGPSGHSTPAVPAPAIPSNPTTGGGTSISFTGICCCDCSSTSAGPCTPAPASRSWRCCAAPSEATCPALVFRTLTASFSNLAASASRSGPLRLAHASMSSALGNQNAGACPRS